MEDIRRQLEVLDLKVNCSFENLQKHVLDKVDRVVEQKLRHFKE